MRQYTFYRQENKPWDIKQVTDVHQWVNAGLGAGIQVFSGPKTLSTLLNWEANPDM